MKKLVIKTVVLTFISFIALFLIFYCCFSAAAPKTLADVWSDMGSYSFSIKYYEKQYEKTNDLFDLAVLCNKVNEQSDSSRAVTYLKALTEHENFSALCETEDKKFSYTFTAYEFYFGKYAVASYYESGIGSALAVAEKSVKTGYTEHSAFYSLLGIESLTKDDGDSIKTAIEGLSGLSETEQGFANRDVKFAEEIK